MKSEKEKMLAGEWFDPRDEELTADRDRATLLMHRLNVECPGHDAAYRAALRELCPNAAGFIRAPFYCDYGYNISAKALSSISTASSSIWLRSGSGAIR